MKVRNVACILAVVLILSCDVKPQEAENNTEVYLSQRQPFKILESDKYIQIPDSLRPYDFHDGLLGITYFVDAEGKIEGVNLGLLRMNDAAGNRLIWYRNKNMKPISKDYYPNEIKPYLKWAFEYATTREIVRIDEVENDLKWRLWVVVRLK